MSSVANPGGPMDLRAIDRLVAEHVMGWTHYDRSRWFTSHGYEMELPFFSEEIDDAWAITDRFGSWSMKRDRDSGVTTVCFEHDGNKHYDQGVTPCLAICLCALRAKGVKVPP